MQRTGMIGSPHGSVVERVLEMRPERRVGTARDYGAMVGRLIRRRFPGRSRAIWMSWASWSLVNGFIRTGTMDWWMPTRVQPAGA